MEDNNPSWDYKPDNESSAAKRSRPVKPISWQASEYIEHQHGAGWYGMLVLVTVALAAAVFFATNRDYIATAIIVIVGIIVGIFARQKPGQVQYEISEEGLSVGSKTYKYNEFKSFAVIREGALSSINLFPLKRFMPPVSAYFPPDNEQKIIETLGNYLPYEERKLDSIDRLSRRLRL